MNIEKWIRQRRQSVIEIYDLEARKKVAETVLSEIGQKERASKRSREKYAAKMVEAEAIMTSTAGHDGWDWAIAAVGVFVVDVGVWYWTRRTSMPGLSVLEVLLVSLFAAGVLAVIGHAVTRIGCTVRFNAEATIRRHRVLAWFSGGLAVVSGLWILVMSYLAPELIEAVLMLGWVPFVGLNIGGPVCAGVCSSASWYLLKPEAVKDKHGRAVEAQASLQQFRSWLESQARGGRSAQTEPGKNPHGYRRRVPGAGRPTTEAKPGRPPRETSASAGMKVVTMLIVGLALAAGGSIEAAESVGVITVPPSMNNETVDDTCAVLTDATATVSEHGRRVAIAFVEKTLWSLIEQYGCTRVVAGTFTEDGPWTERKWFEPVPVAPAEIDCNAQFPKASIDCTAAVPEALEGALAAYEDFGNVQDLRKRGAVEACEQATEAQRRERDYQVKACRSGQQGQQLQYEAARTAFARAVVSAIEVTEPQTQVTTEIVALLESLVVADRMRVVVLITDALDTGWQRTGTLPTVTVPGQRRAVMLVTDADTAYADQSRVLAAVRAWRRAVPGMAVVLTSELNDGLWAGLARRRR